MLIFTRNKKHKGEMGTKIRKSDQWRLENLESINIFRSGGGGGGGRVSYKNILGVSVQLHLDHPTMEILVYTTVYAIAETAFNVTDVKSNQICIDFFSSF